MSRVLIIGCGGVASVAIHKCCQVSEGIQISEAVNTFDADGNKISTESEMKNGYKIRSEFEYDEEKRLILTRTILKNSKTEIISEYEDYT